jgi:hypothetical protein
MVVLIWIFAGLWPYIKLSISLVVWMAPPTYIGVKKRGMILLWIDALAKLSVVDIFTMLLGIAVLLVFIGGPDKSITSDGVYYALKAVVVPKAGCYCFLIAQRLSRVSSRFLLEYHENIVFCATRRLAEGEGKLSVPEINFRATSASSPEREAEVQTSPNGISATMTNRETVDLNPVAGDEQCSDLSLQQGSQDKTNHTSSTDSSRLTLTNYRWGYWGVVFGFIAIILIFAIGCIFAPAIALDLSTIGGLAVESETTFEEAVAEYGVFVVVSGILVRAKFVLNNKIDYVGLGLLLTAVGISVSLIFIIQSYQFVKRKLQERRIKRENSDSPSNVDDGCGLPSYFRLFMSKHMEIYIISFAIGVWQLGSIASYSMYWYCDLLTQIYDVLTFLGIAEASTTQCFKEQASNGGNLIIIIISFLILSISFYVETRAQYKKNIQDCIKDIDESDVPRFSLVWSSDVSKNSLYSHLTESSTIYNSESFREFASPRSLSRVSSAYNNGSDQSPPLDAISELSQHGDRDYGTSSLVISNELPGRCPVAAESRSRRIDRKDVIDAKCEVVITPPLLKPCEESLKEPVDLQGTDAPPFLPRWSMEEDPPEVRSSEALAPARCRTIWLSFLFNHLPSGPRRSLSPPTVMTTSDESIAPIDNTMKAPLPRLRRDRSSH